jgi:NitT/TauT family transport system ATP-binding protein
MTMPAATPGAPPKLQLDHISHFFPAPDGGRLEVLRDISLSLNAGEFVTVIGASGSGKTSLLRIVDHLISADEGSVLIDGKKVDGPGGKLSFVFQRDSLLPWRTVVANVSYGLELRGVPKPQARDQAQAYVDLVGLGGFERYLPHQLSGGMRQRVNLARALAVEPDVLLMDEPFAALDAQTREMMQVELMRIWQETGKTVLFVTHQLDEAVFLADRVVVLSARPGSVREIIDIDIPRPRTIDTKRSEVFQQYVAQLWSHIQSDVIRDFVPQQQTGSVSH